MKKLLLIILFSPLVINAQIVTAVGSFNNVTKTKGGVMNDSVDVIPIRDTNFLYPNVPLRGRVQMYSQNNRPIYNNGSGWRFYEDRTNHFGTQAISTVTGLQSALNGKANSATTLSGYGITDAYPSVGNPSGFLIGYTETDPIWNAEKSNYLTISSAASTYQLIGTYATASNTMSFSNKSGNISQWANNIGYLIANQTITLSGDVSGSGSTAITTVLSNTGITAGTYGVLTIDAKGRATAGKRQETHSGTTNSSGTYTVTYATAYSTIPNLQYNIGVGGTNKETVLLTASSTTGFTIYVQARTDIAGLLPSYTNVNGRAVDVLVTEK